MAVRKPERFSSSAMSGSGALAIAAESECVSCKSDRFQEYKERGQTVPTRRESETHTLRKVLIIPQDFG